LALRALLGLRVIFNYLIITLHIGTLSYWHIITSPHHQSFFNAGNPKWYFTAKKRMDITEAAEIICVISTWKCSIVHT
jgi:hypothetical protein